MTRVVARRSSLPAKEKRMEREKGMKEEDRVFWSIFFYECSERVCNSISPIHMKL